MQKDPHELAESRSLALHRAIADRLASEPGLVARARERLNHWAGVGQIHPEYAAQWRKLLDGPVASLVAAMTEPGEAGRSLRHSTPFTFVIAPAERWEIWRRAREQWEGDR